MSSLPPVSFSAQKVNPVVEKKVASPVITEAEDGLPRQFKVNPVITEAEDGLPRQFKANPVDDLTVKSFTPDAPAVTSVPLADDGTSDPTIQKAKSKLTLSDFELFKRLHFTLMGNSELSGGASAASLTQQDMNKYFELLSKSNS